ncbi:helix-turn-helix domain-containing protein [Streptomyces sp. ODS28]|uniref:helix-turn-helix domain-containing protein n=1 Tax=Streptomyces sp. ODS28 TaxID=3136688 RepID=UPI0031ECCD0E
MTASVASTPPPHRVVAVAHPPASSYLLGCAAEVFGPHGELPHRYAFGLCAVEPGPVATDTGSELLVREGLEALEGAGTVLVPGWFPASAPVPGALVEALRAAHARGARVVTSCSGAFVLADAGLLDGRTATTHWRLAGELARRHPRITVEPDVLYIDHGDVATSAGSGAGVDLFLHLVREDRGAAHAAQVARHMVTPPHREGGQLQYAAPPVGSSATPDPCDSLAPLLEWARQRLGERITVEELAERAAVSPRTLARRFTGQLGVGPGQWLLAQRLDWARELLESTDLPVDAIAARTGLSTATNLRRRFRAALHTTPAAYRRAFRGAP